MRRVGPGNTYIPTGRMVRSSVSDVSPEKSFETLKQNVVNTVSSHFPYEGRSQRIVLNKVWVDDKHDSGNIRAQTEAKDLERTWGVPVKADISLIDKNTGKVVDKHTMTLARLPKMTNRYGFIVNGNEYQVDHLFRLKSGVYARVQDNGDLESEFNLVKGQNFSIKLDREKKQFSIKHGTAHIPLYPVLKSMGVSDDDLEKEWGKEIFAANKPKNEKKLHNSLVKFFDKTSDEGDSKPTDLAGYAKYVNDYFDQTVVRPDTTKQTLGKPFEKVTGETLRLAANKILGVSRGTHAPDDRDSLAFKEVVSAEDFIPEALAKNARSIKARLRQTADHKHRVVEIVQPRLFEDPIIDFFTKGGSVSERSDQTNPVQMMSAHRKTTLMSDQFGGIKNEHSLTSDMQVINPSHFGFLDPMHTPESERTGITLHLGIGVRKNGKNLETPAFNLQTGKLEHIPATDFNGITAVLPDQVRWENGKPHPIKSMVKVKTPGGHIELRPFKDATHVMPSAKGLFSPASNLIPFLQNNQGNRVSMADKQMEQAISLKHREAPLVQSKTDHPDQNHTFEKLFGGFSSIKSPVGGKVVKVEKDHIVVQDGKQKHEVHLYDHFPLNDPKGMMHSDVKVKAGDTVKPGQLVADTNFTKDGVLAMGTNLRVGYVPYKGYNYEDGIVISESASKKLTSEHLYKKKIEIDPDLHVVGKKQFHAHAATQTAQMPKEHWEALGDDGVIKAGTKVQPGQVLVAALQKNTNTKQGSVLAKAGKRHFSAFKNAALTWDEDHVGVVTKVVRDPSGKGVKVYVRTEEQMEVGDKISGRHGNKGIVTQILPDHEMPFTVDANGEKKPLEVLLNPSGVPTRINVGQILETAAAKVAEKTGKTFVVDNFAGPDRDYRKHVSEELKKHGLSDEEHVFDPLDPRRPLGSVLVGPQYLFKLKHQVEKKLTVRGGGTDINGKPLPVDSERQPQKGGERGGQGFGALELYSLLGHNARHNLREMATYKSDYQPMDFWSHIQSGFEPPPPNVPFAYEKFVGLLRGMGVNVTKKGTQLQLHPMTSKEVIEMAGGARGEIKKGNLAFHSKNLKEEKDGLFDPHITGGLNGTKWSYMKIHEPMPNPMFVGSNNRMGPIPQLLNLKIEDVDAIMEGRKTLEGKSGGHAIEAALKKIDVGDEIKKLKSELPTLKGTNLDRANKKLKVLLSLHDLGLKPHEAYVMHAVPVLPPAFRPATPTPSGDVTLAPINGLYRNFATLNDKLKEADPAVYGEALRHPLREQLWNSLKAIQAVGNYKPVYEESSSKRKLTGLLTSIATGAEGNQPKQGYFQERLIKRRQNLSIRSTIVPEPKLHIDEVGLPKNAAMELYKPFVVADLTKHGFDPLTAQQEMKKGSKVAFDALERVTKDRPLLLKRDPSLHKFSVMAFRPVLVDGKAIQIHPLVTGGFNADFDGDTMAGTVPISREAVEEAKKMFPSKNLFSPTTGGVMYTPSQEAMLGLHLLSQWGKKTNKSFSNPLEANKAADKGEISHTDVIKINGKETTLGRYRIAERLPKDFGIRSKILHDPSFEVTKKTLGRDVSERLAKEHPGHFANSIDDLKNLGNSYAYEAGFSFGLKDLTPLKTRDPIIEKAHKEVAHIRSTVKDPTERDRKVVETYQKATEHLEKEMEQHLKNSDNRLARMVYSGARGKVEQLRQMVAAPMLMQDAQNRTIPLPVTRSYSEGLDLGDYWLAQHGARKGTLQRVQGTAEPGAISKDIINTTMSTLVTSHDCKTNQGVHMSLDHHDIHDRFLAKGYKLKDGTNLKEGTLLTPEIVSRLKNSKENKVLVRSPLKCQHGDGICAKCYGLNEAGKLHDVGTNIGVLSGQALGEPAVQMAMDAFHSGGIASGRGAHSVSRFERLRQLLSMPKQIKNEATVSRVAGKITDIRKDPAGGLDVFVNGERHYVPRNVVNPNLKVGEEVRRGQSLSHPDAPLNPHHLLRHTDMPTVQNYLTNELHQGLYEKEGVRRRNVEVVVRALTNLTKVVDPGHSNYAHGDIVPHSVVEEHNRSVGKGKKAVVHEPILRAIEQVPLTGTENWMARLNYRQLHKTVQEAASQGWKSDLHGSHPIPGIAYGKEFGKPPAGSKSHVY